MSVYKIKKTLTILPALLLIFIAVLIFLLIPHTLEVLLFFYLCLLSSAILFLFGFVKFIITEEYISYPFIIKIRKISWDKVGEVKISKSTISGYLYVSISCLDNGKSIIVGNWFNGKDKFIDEIKRYAISAKFYF